MPVTDRQGRVAFKTVFPGWYRGRTVHIHTKVHVDGKWTDAGYEDGKWTDAGYVDGKWTDAGYEDGHACHTGFVVLVVSAGLVRSRPCRPRPADRRPGSWGRPGHSSGDAPSSSSRSAMSVDQAWAHAFRSVSWSSDRPYASNAESGKWSVPSSRVRRAGRSKSSRA
ncbi:hypothetical protein QFZ56_004039 [Streptomyces achromogenes]|uniref:Intradiol ring-cleavage dioxygenases domain-containing protein n=1 Tax=Streptomyces achromogenes TaxID=67255 RepID=A0ABU0Q4I5_STRAH|nr:hypothetical protein [Streptomyces achromogenes]